MNKSVLKNNTKRALFKGIILGLLMFSFCSLSAQTTEVKTLVNKMFKDVLSKDFESILDMTHPKVFDIVPKEQMLPLIKSTFEGNEEFSIELSNKVPEFKISEIFKGKEKNLEYAFVSYDLGMKMTFKKQEFDNEAKEMMTKMMKAQGMEAKFISNNTLKIVKNNSLTILIKEDSTNNEWKMLNYDANSPLSYQVLSSELLEKSKAYLQNLMLEDKKKSEN